MYLVGYMFYPSKGTIETRKLKEKEGVKLYLQAIKEEEEKIRARKKKKSVCCVLVSPIFGN